MQFIARILNAAKKLGISLIIHYQGAPDSRYSQCVQLVHKGLLKQHLYIDNVNDPQSDAECHFDITPSGMRYLTLYDTLTDDMESNCNLIVDISRKQFPLFFCMILWIVGTLSISLSHIFTINWITDFGIGGLVVIISLYHAYQESYWNRKNKKMQKYLVSRYKLSKRKIHTY